MKLLATADWQAGCTTVDLADQEAVWQQSVDLAITHQADIYLHGGDVFHGPTLTPEQLAAVRRVFNRLRSAGIPVVVARGNGSHDLSMREVNALDVFRDYDGITVSDRPESFLVGDCWISTLPWVSPARLIAQHGGDVDHDALNEATSRLLVRIAADLKVAAAPDDERPHICLAHYAISGSKLPSGMAADDMREPVLPWADLDALGYDLIVAGHIHEPQRLDNPDLGDKTVGIVPGSPQQLNFGEHGEHGVWLVDLGTGPFGSPFVEAEFVPLKSRRFVTINWWPEKGWRAWQADEAGFLESVDGGYVRFRFEATEEVAREIDHDRIRREFIEQGAHSVKIEPTIIRERRVRAVAMTEQDGPLDSLAAYCESENLDEEMALRMGATLREWL